MYNIPLFKLNYDEEEEKSVLETIRSRWISTGPKCEQLENMFANMLDSKYAVALSNCTDALHLAFYALDIGEGDEVICPSLTFAATVNSIRYVNATPVFCDISGCDNLNIDPKEIRKAITPKTKAIVVMHYAGFPCDMNSIKEIADEYSLKIIEDACHGPLSEYNGKKLGTIGDVGCFSFFSNKNISTGEGGMLVTNDETIYKRCKSLRSHGMSTMSYQRATGHATEYDIQEIGFNFRMDDIRASLGIAQLNKLQKDLEKRVVIREEYIKRLSNIEGICVPFADNQNFVSNYIMPIVLLDSNKSKRDAIRNYLHNAGVQTSVHYPAIHRFTAYEQYKKDLPLTEYVTDNEFTIPMYASLNNDEIVYICEKIEEALKAVE